MGKIKWLALIAILIPSSILAKEGSAGNGVKGGMVITTFDSNAGGINLAAIQSAAIQPDGKIVAVGVVSKMGKESLGNFAVARYEPNGRPDPKFGEGGKVTTAFESKDSVAYGVAIQVDGKIVVVGNASEPSNKSYFAMIRYKSDGGIDDSFGKGGKVTTDFGADRSAYASSVAIQPDGKIVVAGSVCPTSSNVCDFAIARYNPDGSIDTGFGSGGKVITDFTQGWSNAQPSQDQLGIWNRVAAYNQKGDDARSVAIQSDGKIVAAGSSCEANYTNCSIAMARYNPDGSLDVGFGNGGRVITNLGSNNADYQGNDTAYSLAIQADGKILVAGSSYYNAPRHAFAILRYEPNGRLDAGFGNAGWVTTTFIPANEDVYEDSTAYSLKIQADGKIVAAGTTCKAAYNDCDIGIARYEPNGRLDAGFGRGGKVITNFGGEELANSIVIQPDGKIVVAAFTGAGYASRASSKSDFALVRYDQRGRLDLSFGGGKK